ncbi:MAG: hypothetical protein HQL67_12115 [Magnetococcales bacterium]|nr:hypothetical protein [Magnetococcales bacterium]
MTTKIEQTPPELPEKKHRRRRKLDVLSTFFVWISVICWALFIFAMLLIDQASPEMQNIFSNYLELELRQTWDRERVGKALNLMYAVAGFSFFALILKSMRHRRRADRYPLTLIILFVCSMLGAFLLQAKI